MAEAATAGEAPLHRGLPDEIAIWEILVRLPPKALLRCRAWRRAASSRDFLLAHHGHQPTLPILYTHFNDAIIQSIDIVPLNHQAGVAAADRLRPVARLGSDDNTYMHLEASCDGLLVLSTLGFSGFSGALYFSVCNPATRQYAPLPLLRGFSLAGMYPHAPTGEYRLLLCPDETVRRHERHPSTQDGCYVYALGSCQPPRHIGWPEEEELINTLVPVLLRGSLHWFLEPKGEENMIIVFDTTAELFRRMRAPNLPDPADLFEMGGMLGVASFNDASKTIGIWMMQDYEGEAWAFRCQVELPVAELTEQSDIYSNLVVSSWDDNDVHILVKSGDWLLQIDIAGKLVARYHSKFLGRTEFRLKETLVQHTFFPAIEGYVVNTWPFISPDDYVQCGAASYSCLYPHELQYV